MNGALGAENKRRAEPRTHHPLIRLRCYAWRCRCGMPTNSDFQCKLPLGMVRKEIARLRSLSTLPFSKSIESYGEASR